MDCKAFEERIGDYLEQGLDPQPRRAFSAHLLRCVDCRALFDDIRENIELCRATSNSASPPDAGLKEKPSQNDHDLKIHFLPPPAGAIRIHKPTIGEMISCRVFDALIGDYFDASPTDASAAITLASNSAELVADHLVDCSACATLFEGLRQASETPVAEMVPDDHKQALLEARILAVTAGACR